ncbi:MAG: hypothetical protein EOO15_15685 [Chitinophagaceae bacterium]|nr:MAG: hypothetical protein EOO15_15685 [Chitinophagaceae bacterium]
MATNNERPALSNATAGFNAPQIPEVNSSTADRPRRYDPASDRVGASYPIPAFDHRLDARSRNVA